MGTQSVVTLRIEIVHTRTVFAVVVAASKVELPPTRKWQRGCELIKLFPVVNFTARAHIPRARKYILYGYEWSLRCSPLNLQTFPAPVRAHTNTYTPTVVKYAKYTTLGKTVRGMYNVDLHRRFPWES